MMTERSHHGGDTLKVHGENNIDSDDNIE